MRSLSLPEARVKVPVRSDFRSRSFFREEAVWSMGDDWKRGACEASADLLLVLASHRERGVICAR